MQFTDAVFHALKAAVGPDVNVLKRQALIFTDEIGGRSDLVRAKATKIRELWRRTQDRNGCRGEVSGWADRRRRPGAGVMAYAENTSVSVSKTKGEIDGLLRKHKATSFGAFEEQNRALLVFQMQERRIRFELPLPSPTEKRSP